MSCAPNLVRLEHNDLIRFEQTKVCCCGLSWKAGFRPSGLLWIPNARLLRPLVANDDIKIAIIIEIEEAHSVIEAVGGAQRLAAEEVFVQPLLGLAKIQELDLLAMFFYCVIDELQHLLGPNPAVRMKDKGEQSLFEHRGVKGRFPISNGDGVGWTMRIVSFPVAWNHGRKFPAQLA